MNKFHNLHFRSTINGGVTCFLILFFKRDDSYLVIGMADGAISLQQRKSNAPKTSGPRRANNKSFRGKIDRTTKRMWSENFSAKHFDTSGKKAKRVSSFG